MDTDQPAALASTRKCPACGMWSEWSGQPTETCRHCGALLDPEGVRKADLAREQDEKNRRTFSVNLIEVDPNEPFYKRGPKQLIRALQISFVALVSFIIWLIVMVAS